MIAFSPFTLFQHGGADKQSIGDFEKKSNMMWEEVKQKRKKGKKKGKQAF